MFKDGRPDGDGMLTLNNGFHYVGQWAGGKIDGTGVATFENGDVYTGDFVAGKPQGTGKMVYKSGRVFYCIWEDGAEKQPLEEPAPKAVVEGAQ
jgi:hypothetical protein